jgi:hypothetical protein
MKSRGPEIGILVRKTANIRRVKGRAGLDTQQRMKMILKRMKMISMALLATVIVCGTIGQTSWKNSTGDSDEIVRQKADKVMTDAYGANWYDIYIGCVKTNRTLSKAMTATYEAAIGYQRAK